MAGIHNALAGAGAGARPQITVNITANQTNYVFNTAKVSGLGYVPGSSDIVFNIGSGVILSASSTGVYAGNVDTSWAAGDTVRINNNGGVIVGVGGVGGGGQGNTGAGAGAAGGPAFIAQRPISFNNGGTIAGGGGGGGGGAEARNGYNDGKGGTVCIGAIGGAGGGGGRSSAAANAAGGATGGGTGTYSGPGAGGPAVAGYPGCASGSAGASGGGWGAAGGTSFYSGGAGGAAVAGNSNITWVATGTRLGAIT